MKKILITGGSGFIGTNFINFLSKKKTKILNIDKLSAVSTPERFKNILFKKKYFFVKNDLQNIHKIYKILTKFNPDIIINFAAESHVDRSINDPLYFIRNNINSSSNLFFAYSKFFRKKKIKFFHISTDEVYGSTNQGAFKENDAYEPSSPYSASKGCTDLIAMSFNRTYSTNIKIINLTNNYGPYQYPEKFIPTLIFHFLKDIPAPIYGTGKNVREWIHVDDSCNAIWNTIRSNKNFEKINIGSTRRASNIEIAKIVFKIMKQKNLTKLKENNFLKSVKDRPGHDKRYALNTTYFKKTIGYKMKFNLSLGLRNTIEWYIKNIKWLKSTKKSYSFKRLGLL
jgi:dTDP-glucose 4,6-dehydratase